MGVKGVNLIEQHVEKFVLVAATAACLGVLTWQFIGPKNTVKVGRTDKVPVTEAFNEVRKQAENTRTEIDTPMQKDELQRDRFITRFDTGIKSGVLGTSQIAGVWGVGGTSIQIDPSFNTAAIGMSDAPVHVPTVPPPSTPVARQYAAAIAASEVAANAGLAAFVPDEAPFDTAWVSVETTFDGGALRDALAADPDGPDGARALPEPWWNGRTDLLAVQVQRESLDADGNWTDRIDVAMIPGQFNLLGDSGAPRSIQEMEELLQHARSQRDQIRRPQFYQVAYGEKWTPPMAEQADLGSLAALQEQVRLDEKRIDEIDKDLERLQMRLNDGNQSNQPQPGRRPGGGGFGQPTREGGGGDAGEQPETPEQRRRRQLEQTIERKQQERDRFVQSLDDSRRQVEEMFDTELEVIVDDAPTLQSDDIRLWAHDLSVERGKSYRYRLGLTINNPLFGNQAALVEDQKTLAQQPTLVGTWSGWSEPIAVDSATRFFVKSAKADDELTGVPTATIEVYHFYAGWFRRGAVTLEPGDAVMADVRVPILASMDMPAADAPQPGLPPQRPPQRDPRGDPRDGRDPLAPSGFGNPAGAPGVPGGQPVDPTAAEAALTDQTERRSVESDAVLLDVAGVPGADRSSVQVYLHDGVGVSIRTPATDATSPSFLRVRLSYERGQLQDRAWDTIAPTDQNPGRFPGGRDGGDDGRREPPMPGAPRAPGTGFGS